MKKFYLFLVLAIAFASTSLKAQSGKSLVLNGTDQYMLIPHHDDFNIALDESYTITAYVKTSKYTGRAYPRFVAKRVKTQGNETGYELWGLQDRNHFFANTAPNEAGGHSVSMSSWSNQPGDLDTWVHIAFVVDRAANKMYLYQNGVLAANSGGKQIDKWSVTNSFDVVLGATMNNATDAFAHYFEGELDNVRFWKRALTADEMKADMTAATPATDGLVAAYDFENIDGVNVPDVSGSANVHNGTLKGFDVPVETQEYKIYMAPDNKAGTVTIEGYTGEYGQGEEMGFPYISAQLEKGKEYQLNVVTNEGYELTAISDMQGGNFTATKRVVAGEFEILATIEWEKKVVAAEIQEYKIIILPTEAAGNVTVEGYTGEYTKGKTDGASYIAVQLEKGKEYQLNVVANEGYKLMTVNGLDGNALVDNKVVAGEAPFILGAAIFTRRAAVAKEFTLTSEATGYEAGSAKIVFEGATDGKIVEGKKVTLKVSNDSDEVAYIKTVKVNGVAITEGNLFEETYEKELAVTEDTKVEVEFFEPKKLIISPMRGEADIEVVNAKLIDGNKYYAPAGEEVEIKVTPKTGYELIRIEPSTKFIVKKRTTFVKIRLKALVEQQTITIPEVENGTITLDGVQSGDKVIEGKEVAITVTPAEGYELETLTVGGVDVKDSKKFTVGKNNTIVVKFKRTAAIEGIEGVSYQVYPNPTADFVQLQGFTANTEVRLISLTGKTVLTSKTSIDGSATLNLADLARGLYLVRCGNIVVKLQVR